MFKPSWIALTLASGVLGIALMALQLTSAPSARAQGPAPIYLPHIGVNCPKLLIQDPGFEAGTPNASWAVSSTLSSAIIDSTSTIPSPNPTNTGLWKAWLGGNDSVSESIWQTITVPANTTSLQVSFWRRVTTQEPNPLINDSLAVLLRNTSGVPLEAALYTLFDGDAGSTWVQHTVSAIGNYAGQTIHLAFLAQTDTTDATNFFIDDVMVFAGCAP
ncbi:MAG: choice-of-anchor J domain-containing protein [Chloroflexi bacterium]|nr:choice-of-anchor J domain-containing protein [Chloroflexota bacterium]